VSTRQDKDVMANRRFGPLGALRAWLAVTGWGIVSVSTSFAEERAAWLLPPISAPSTPSFRASGNELFPGDTPTPDIKPSQRDPDFQYPTPYNGAKRNGDLMDVSGLWKKVLDGKIQGGSNEKKSDPTSNEAEITLAKFARNMPEPILAVSPTPPVAGPAPAWRWYGYGAPNQSLNPYAPNGVYGPVNPDWHPPSRTTPGAIPQLQREELPVPKNTEPPREMSRSRIEPPVQPLPDSRPAAGLILPPDVPEQIRPAGLQLPAAGPPPARIEMPVSPSIVPQQDRSYTPILPLSSKTANPITRAQSPDMAGLTTSVIAALRKTCTGYATKIELRPNGPGKIGMKLTLAQGILADRLADRIAKIPELSGFEIEMEFVR
jgi:hypothetical protein